MDQFEVEVYNVIRSLGIPAHVRGYEFIKSAMRHIRKNPNDIYRITQGLYPAVARLHGDTVEPSHVERGIRHALSISRADDAMWMGVIGRARPISNGEFLATLGEVVRVRLAGKEVGNE